MVRMSQRSVGGTERRRWPEKAETHALHYKRSRIDQRRRRPFPHRERTRQEIESVLSRAIKVVVLEVPHDGVVPILEGSELGSLARSGEVGLEGAGAGVGGRDDVGVVGPDCR
jgi:hypothetical protein